MQHDGTGMGSEHQVILIAAGCSRRLAQLTKETPKPFLPLAPEKSIIEHNLDQLEAAGLQDVIIVVGYLKEVFHERLGNGYKNLRIRYVESPDYETTGHGWSLFQTRQLWEQERRPVLLVHGDLIYTPEILQMVIEAPEENVLSVDESFEQKTNDEVLVYGSKARITSIVHPSFQTVKSSTTDLLGECIAINKWSAAYMNDLFRFMEEFFRKHGRAFNWEPVVDAFIPESRHVLTPVLTRGLPWVNINYEEDLRTAQELYKQLQANNG